MERRRVDGVPCVGLRIRDGNSTCHNVCAYHKFNDAFSIKCWYAICAGMKGFLIAAPKALLLHHG